MSQIHEWFNQNPGLSGLSQLSLSLSYCGLSYATPPPTPRKRAGRVTPATVTVPVRVAAIIVARTVMQATHPALAAALAIVAAEVPALKVETKKNQ